MLEAALSDVEFVRFRRLLYDTAGIQLSDAKKVLVGSRLQARLRARGTASYTAYFKLITGAGEETELQTAIDLLTTNETYFFREPKHFEFLGRLLARRSRTAVPFRVWSAASSSGEEAFSIAMVLADRLGEAPWEIFGSDLSTRVLARARTGHYSMERASGIPADYLRKYCLKGTGPEQGTLLLREDLRERVRFEQVNLMQRLPDVGIFDLIFLRNVMIYFDNDTKRGVVERLVERLAPGGHLLIGHSETLNGIFQGLESVAPATYRKPVR